MATNIGRLLQLRKDNELNKYFSALSKKFPQYNLGAKTPILNHHLQTENNFEKKPATLFMSEHATHVLDFIRRLAQKKTTYRLDKGKEDTPIEFFCTGYQDLNGDIVINNIDFPAYVYAQEQSSTQSEICHKLFNNKMDSYTKIEGFCSYFDYLRETDFNYEHSGAIKPVALYGVTKPVIDYKDGTENCIRFNELAKSIVPGDVGFGEIISGVLSVAPYSLAQTKEGFVYVDGSLEAILTRYNINQKTGYLTPAYITNVTKCQAIKNDCPANFVQISQSSQPNWDYPVICKDDKIRY